ncbi:hypothetical protein QUB75_02295 [Microcoleus sp. K1-B6]|uniref:hypothetical protein n=1 Tax=unclassified Microcoleus TaxID=2642155 RepID=UPI002FD6A0F0
MESNNKFFQKVPSESQQENSSAEELNELELEAIAGGCSDAVDQARAAGIPVLTINQPPPKLRLTIPTKMLELLGS